MIEFCIGLAEMFLLIVVGQWIRPHPKGFQVEGFGGILLTGCICYGLGALTLLIFR